MNKKEIVLISVFAACLGAAGSALGVKYKYQNEIDFYNKYKLVDEAVKIMDDSKLPLPDDADIVASIVNGYLDAYNDNYTHYYPPENTATKEYIVDNVNKYPTALGMGVKLAYNNNGELYFEEVEEKMPAEEQGVEKGDVILAINGELASEGKYNYALKFNGADGTTMSLDILRNGQKVSIELLRVCADIDEMDIEIHSEKIGTTLYVSLDRFRVTTHIYLETAIKSDKYDSLIIDLRNNLGGDIEPCVAAAGKIVDDGSVKLCYYNLNKTEEYHVKKENDIDNVPIVVLVNEKTASSAEILTALLKQYGGATIVGTTTFGKGIFQKTKTLSNGGLLHYTAGYYTVGEWECYHNKGIEPDIRVEMDSSLIGTDNDIQLKKAIEILR